MELVVQCFAVFQKGGPVMYLLLACSLAVVAIGVERYLYFREGKALAGGPGEGIKPALEGGEWDKALEIARQTGGIVAGIAAKGICYYRQGVSSIESVLEGEASLAAARLRENLNHLDMIVTIAPLLGLLGTVIGMIQSFSVMNIKSGQPLAITGGVGEALVATATGLCVAVVSMVLYSYFSHRLDRIVTDIEEICTVLIAQADRERGR
ncbi:MAG TPA: MotA/TolQ/ExbB proton channel family protein [Negativicutes bacterium]|nr:MotA/TolQ/ExbB proton channel family protein [Negativicutes bacterium]